MPETRVKCPSCETVLKLTAPVASGKAILCPKCGAAIRVPAPADKPGEPVAPRAAARLQPARVARKPAPEEEEAEEREDLEDEEEAPWPGEAARRAAEDEDEDFDERPRKRRKKPKRKQGNPVLLWGSIGGGIAAILIVVVVLFATGVIGSKKGDQGSGGKRQDERGSGARLAAQIVGTWEQIEAGARTKTKETLELKADGRATATVKRSDSSIVATGTGTYKCITDEEMVLHLTLAGQSGEVPVTVAIDGDEMTADFHGGKLIRYKRVK